MRSSSHSFGEAPPSPRQDFCPASTLETKTLQPTVDSINLLSDVFHPAFAETRARANTRLVLSSFRVSIVQMARAFRRA
ncbi:MAG TPA: hypothetical protein VF666_16025 [Pyrinomonadaceae bacterium]